MKSINICLISLRSYPLFAKQSTEYFGGAEVQMSLIAKKLAEDGQLQVSLIVKDYGQKKVVKTKNVTIFKTKINPVIFFGLLKQVNADVYIERTAGLKVILVNWFCKFFNKKFVYMIAHDLDVNSWWFYYFGLKGADLIIAQTKHQKQKLKTRYNLDSTVMPPLVSSSKNDKKIHKREFVLWVGRADAWKRPFEYLNLLEKNPHEKFVMICRQGKDKKLFKKVKKLAELQSNLKFFPAIPIEEIIEFFAKAKLFVNTSTTEGFPNTFLQAGIAKTPLLSLKVNPDKYIDQYGCGLTADNNQKKMIKLSRKMLKNPKALKILGQNHYNYVKKNHNLKKINIFKTATWKLLS